MTFPMNLAPGGKRSRLATEPPAPEQLKDDELGWLSALRAIRRRLPLIVLVTLAICLLALPFILGLEKSYYAETRVMISRAPASALADAATIRQGEMDITAEVERLGSSETAEAVIARFGLEQREEFNPDLRPDPLLKRALGWFVPQAPAAQRSEQDSAAQVLAEYRGALAIRQQGRSNVVTIGFTSQDRALAAQVPAAVAEIYRAQGETRWRAEVAEAAGWLQGRIETARAQVAQSRAALETAGVEGDAASTETVAASLNRLNALETSGARVAQELSELETTLASVTAAQGDIALSALTEPQALQDLRRELQRETRELENATITFGEKSDVVVRGRARAETIRDDIRSELAAYRNGLELRQKLLTVQSGDLQRRATLARERLAGQQRAALEREHRAEVLRAQEQSLSQFEYRQQSLLAEGRMSPITLDVLSPALTPRFPLGPGRKVYLLLAIFAGGLIALTIAGALELSDRSVRSHEQLAHLRQVIPVGYLPAAPGDGTPSWPPTLLFGECLSRAVHLMETANHGEFPASVLVFPASGRVGAGRTARWIALDLIASGQKVLLVEVQDGRGTPSPTVADSLSIGNIESGQADGIDRLRLDARLVQGERFQPRLTAFLTDAACAGYVTIFDGPPLDRLITLKIAQLVELRLLVLDWGHTERPTAELIAELSIKSGIAPLSSLIVGVKPARHSKYGFTDFITLTARGRGSDAA